MKLVFALSVMIWLATACASAEDKATSIPTTPVPSALPAAPGPKANAELASATAPLIAPLAPTAPAATLAFIKPERTASTHRFFDVQNSIGLAALAATLSGDALSTQKGLGLPGFHEMNPVASPFVQNRAGAALYNAASFSLMGGGMYLAHRTNHHRLERILPFAIAGWEGVLTYRNYHLISSSTKTR